MSKQLTVAAYIVQRLAREGITDCFGVAGDFAFKLNDSVSCHPQAAESQPLLDVGSLGKHRRHCCPAGRGAVCEAGTASRDVRARNPTASDL
jgi:hypothetical protein